MTSFVADDFSSYTIGILVLFVGIQLNRRVPWLRKYNIPEPVTGGLLAAVVIFAIFALARVEISFDLATRDRLLVYFFTAIGLNARFSDLVKGGRPLFVLLGLTLSFIVIQTMVGVAGAALVGVPTPVGVLAGSTSLIGGHGTAIAWAPEVVKLGVENALEIGVACATLGLVVASLVGGPIARYLIHRHQLSGEDSQARVVGIAYEKANRESINHLSIMAVLLTLHIAIILGYLANEAILAAGLKLPLFVSCLLVAILLSNTVPHLLPGVHWPARTRALALVSDFSLGLFLSMSLMSMQLWTIAGLAGPLLLILLLQTVAAVTFILWVLFPLMGKDYQAAVLSAGFGGFALGATPTAIANMTAVTKAHGPAPTAFLILPLVAAFFVDVTNAFVIGFALTF
ncbi:MAG: sodium/glutamate symporter [Holophagales bacterium]|nr:sodium/glutamate symporter [Holophagales bacterium]